LLITTVSEVDKITPCPNKQIFCYGTVIHLPKGRCSVMHDNVIGSKILNLIILSQTYLPNSAINLSLNLPQNCKMTFTGPSNINKEELLLLLVIIITLV